MSPKGDKTPFEGIVVSVQPRIRLLRSFDQVQHNYLGYVLSLAGTIGGQSAQTFSIAVGKAAHIKYQFRVGDQIRGDCSPVENPDLESAGYYKISGVEILKRAAGEIEYQPGPPFLDLAPSLEEYRERGHRRLDPDTYAGKCSFCVWGCRMPVEMIIDQWNPSNKRYRFETFCYGPDDCSLYQAGKKRVVPGRKGMKHVEEIEDREIRKGIDRDDRANASD